MAERKATAGKRPVGRPKGSGKGEEHVPVLVQLRKDQRDELRARALERASDGGRLDVSRVLREILDHAFTVRK